MGRGLSLVKEKRIQADFCVTAVQQEFSLGLNFISSSIIFLYVLILNLCTVEWEEN